MIPSRRIQSRIDSIESSIERMKQAEHCGFSSKPTLNQTGELKEAYWLTRIAFSSASNVSASSSVDEVAAGAAPAADRVDDAADHLLHARLALGRAHLAAEVLLRDDVRRGLRPELRELDPLLVEDGLVLARDEGIAELPLHLLERVAARDREEALDADVGGVVRRRVFTTSSVACLGTLRMPSWTPSLPPKNSCVALLPRRGTKEGRASAGRNDFQALCRVFRAATAARAARAGPVRDGRRRGDLHSPHAASGGRGTRLAPAAIRTSATPPRTISGTGSESALAGFALASNGRLRSGRSPTSPSRRRCCPSRQAPRRPSLRQLLRRAAAGAAARAAGRRRRAAVSLRPAVIRFWSACWMSSLALEYVSTSVGQCWSASR